MCGMKVCLATLLVSGVLLALAEGLNDSSGVVKIKLKRRPRKQEDHIYKGSNGLPLVNVYNDFYYGEVYLGTPPQKVLLDFDTGSTDMIVSSTRICDKPKYKEYCETKDHMYDYRKSKTYEEDGKSYTFPYGSLTVNGISSKDTLEINGLKVKSQIFLEVTHIVRGEEPADGLFGLAYKDLSAFKHSDPPFLQLVNQGLLKRAVFSFYLNNNESCTVQDDAELVLGGSDPDHYIGDITYTPVIEKKFWKVEFQNVLFGSHKLVDSTSAIIDSGTTLLYGPCKVVDVINNEIGGEMQRDGTFKVDCAKKTEDLPVFTFTISGKQFQLTAEDYIFPDVNDGNDRTCISVFVADDSMDGGFLMGDILMRRYYTVFDMENDRVGFATAK